MPAFRHVVSFRETIPQHIPDDLISQIRSIVDEHGGAVRLEPRSDHEKGNIDGPLSIWLLIVGRLGIVPDILKLQISHKYILGSETYELHGSDASKILTFRASQLFSSHDQSSRKSIVGIGGLGKTRTLSDNLHQLSLSRTLLSELGDLSSLSSAIETAWQTGTNEIAEELKSINARIEAFLEGSNSPDARSGA
jgi:hypothetical protein